MQQSTGEIAEYSMELMRLNVQSLFDKEIETIVQKYVEVSTEAKACGSVAEPSTMCIENNLFAFAQTYFKPALKNVRENLEDTSMADDYVSVADCVDCGRASTARKLIHFLSLSAAENQL